jgi:hypothetical protein
VKIYFKSPAKTFVADGLHHFKNWIPRRHGRKNRRVVIDTLWAVLDTTDVDVAGTAVEGEDCYRFFKRIEVEQVGGKKRWNLRGDETRQALYMLLPSDQVPEFADLAIANNQTPEFRIPIPLTKHYGVRGKDFGLPAELLSKVTIEGANLAEVGVAGGTIGCVGTYYIIAECHLEESVELKAEDEVRSQPFTNTAGGQLVVQGKLHSLGIFARAAAGGGSQANFTDIRIDKLLPDTYTKEDLRDMFARARGAAANLEATDGAVVRNNPFTLSTMRGVPVIWSDEDTSVLDGDPEDEIVVRMTNSVADQIAIMRVVTPKSEAVGSAVASRHGVGHGGFKMKTKKGSRKDLASWAGRPEDAVFMPAVAPDRQSRGG